MAKLDYAKASREAVHNAILQARDKAAPAAKGRVILSTWPFADGYPWDEELLHAGARALSTHGRSFANPYLPADYVDKLSTTANPAA